MIAMEVKLNAAGLMISPAAVSVASWIQSISCCSELLWRKVRGTSPDASRQIVSIYARVVWP